MYDLNMDASYRTYQWVSHALCRCRVWISSRVSARLATDLVRMAKIIPALADRFTIIAPDLRGLGDSERPLTGYDKRTLASDVSQLLKTLGHEKIGLVGHDWGGTVAYYLAYDHPKLVERLLILESTPGLAREGEAVDLRSIRRLWHVFFQGGAPDMAEMLVRGKKNSISAACVASPATIPPYSAVRKWQSTCVRIHNPAHCVRDFIIIEQPSKKILSTSPTVPQSSRCQYACGAEIASWVT